MKAAKLRMISLARICCVVTVLVSLQRLYGATMISVPDQQVQPGENFIVPVTLTTDTPGGVAISSYQFTLAWAASDAFSFVDIASHSPLLNGIYTTSPQVGTLGIAYSSSTEALLAPGSTLLELRFLSSQTPQETPLTFGDTTFPRRVYNLSGPITVTWGNGTIQVVPEPINVALAVFAGLCVTGTAGRKYWQSRQQRKA